MRKIVCLLLGILATLTICGCGKKSSYYVNQDGISLEKADYSFFTGGYDLFTGTGDVQREISYAGIEFVDTGLRIQHSNQIRYQYRCSDDYANAVRSFESKVVQVYFDDGVILTVGAYPGIEDMITIILRVDSDFQKIEKTKKYRLMEVSHWLYLDIQEKISQNL